MAVVLLYFIFLTLCQYDAASIPNISYPLHITNNFDIQLKAGEDLRTQVKELVKEVESLKRKTSLNSKYCQLLSDGICGPCTCVDERRLPQKYYCDCRNLTPKSDCLDFRQNGFKIDGVYLVTQNHFKTIEAYCDQTTDGGGWTVFQRRLDGSENFHRDWEMYKVGFGDFQHEHWLGNEHINTMLLPGLYKKGNELRIDLMDWNGVMKYAHYKNFELDTEFGKYQIHVGGYSGTAGDSLSGHSKMEFTTIDRDNDVQPNLNCAQHYFGGWWFRSCHDACNLNARYYQLGLPVPPWTGIVWHPWANYHNSLKRTEMKFRRKI